MKSSIYCFQALKRSVMITIIIIFITSQSERYDNKLTAAHTSNQCWLAGQMHLQIVTNKV